MSLPTTSNAHITQLCLQQFITDITDGHENIICIQHRINVILFSNSRLASTVKLAVWLVAYYLKLSNKILFFKFQSKYSSNCQNGTFYCSSHGTNSINVATTAKHLKYIQETKPKSWSSKITFLHDHKDRRKCLHLWYCGTSHLDQRTPMRPTILR